MGAVSFDTLKFANRLKGAGVPPMQAEAEAEALAEAFAANIGDLATKRDLADTERVLRADLAAKFAETDAKIAESKMEIVRWLVGIGLTLAGLLATLVGVFVAILLRLH